MDPHSIYQAWVATTQAAISLDRAVDTRLRPLRLNSAQGAALLALAEHGPQRMSHLARFLLQQTQTTTDLVDRLERRGLVQRVRHETDRRVVLVEVTEAGRALLDAISEAFGSVAQEAFGVVPEASLVELTGTMRRVRDVAAQAGGVPGDHLSYAEEHLNIAALVSGSSTNAAAD